MPLRVVKVPPAAPERSAGYDASLGCPGAGPLLPGAPAIRRNSVTEAQLHRAVARARCRVQSHGQHHGQHRETGFPAHYRLALYATAAPRYANKPPHCGCSSPPLCNQTRVRGCPSARLIAWLLAKRSSSQAHPKPRCCDATKTRRTPRKNELALCCPPTCSRPGRVGARRAQINGRLQRRHALRRRADAAVTSNSVEGVRGGLVVPC